MKFKNKVTGILNWKNKLNLCAKFSANSCDLPEIQAFFLIFWKSANQNKTIANQSKNIISVQLQGLLTGIALITPSGQKKNPIYDKFYQNMSEVFYVQNEQNGTP